MEAKDLRIGNWIDLRDIEDTINNSIEFDYDEGNFYIDGRHIDCIKPIPLTEEWLIKLNFEKHYYLDDQPEQGYYFTLEFFNNDYEDLCLISNEDLTVELFPFSQVYNYVHEVQNLYHAITNTELTIE